MSASDYWIMKWCQRRKRMSIFPSKCCFSNRNLSIFLNPKLGGGAKIKIYPRNLTFSLVPDASQQQKTSATSFPLLWHHRPVEIFTHHLSATASPCRCPGFVWVLFLHRDHRLRHNINQRLDIEGSHRAFFKNLVCFKSQPACFHHCFPASVFLCEEVYWKAIMFASSFHRTASRLITAEMKWSKNMTTTSKESNSLIVL